MEGGETPIPSLRELEVIGYKIALRALTVALAGIPAMERALAALRRGEEPEGLADFGELKDIVGFPGYYESERRYASDQHRAADAGREDTGSR